MYLHARKISITSVCLSLMLVLRLPRTHPEFIGGRVAGLLRGVLQLPGSKQARCSTQPVLTATANRYYSNASEFLKREPDLVHVRRQAGPA
jgi:hypothetical protein